MPVPSVCEPTVTNLIVQVQDSVGCRELPGAGLFVLAGAEQQVASVDQPAALPGVGAGLGINAG